MLCARRAAPAQLLHQRCTSRCVCARAGCSPRRSSTRSTFEAHLCSREAISSRSRAPAACRACAQKLIHVECVHMSMRRTTLCGASFSQCTSEQATQHHPRVGHQETGAMVVWQARRIPPAVAGHRQEMRAGPSPGSTDAAILGAHASSARRSPADSQRALACPLPA